MQMQIEAVRLAPPIAKAIDSVVTKFVTESNHQGIELQMRWHGADLWMLMEDDESLHKLPLSIWESVYDTKFAQEHREYRQSLAGTLSRRVTIGAFSDDPDSLRFIPDLVLHTTTGRFVPQIPRDYTMPEKITASVFELTRLALTDAHPEQIIAGLLDSLLERAWGNVMEQTVERYSAWEPLD